MVLRQLCSFVVKDAARSRLFEDLPARWAEDAFAAHKEAKEITRRTDASTSGSRSDACRAAFLRSQVLFVFPRNFGLQFTVDIFLGLAQDDLAAQPVVPAVVEANAVGLWELLRYQRTRPVQRAASLVRLSQLLVRHGEEQMGHRIAVEI